MPSFLDDTAMLNEAVLEQLTTRGMEKQAEDTINDYTRTILRESGFMSKYLPDKKIEFSDLDHQQDTDDPVKVIEKQPNSPAAMSVGFGTLPKSLYMRNDKYRVTFCRILSPRQIKDTVQLGTWRMDLRQVISDIMVKDLDTERDTKFIEACNAIMIGADQPVPYNGNVSQWRTISGGIGRETLYDARKIMPDGPSHLSPERALVNNITINEVLKFRRDEAGGDLSEAFIRDGFTVTSLFNMDWSVTIKTGLVDDDSIFMFGSPDFMGKHFVLQEATMWVKAEAFMIEFFLYLTLGCSLGHSGAIARADFE